MKKIFSKAAFAAAFLVFASGSAQAIPYTYQFDMPQWSYASDAAVFGSGSILRITVDNGASNIASQTYLNSQISTLAVRANGGSFNYSWTNSGANPATVSGMGNGPSESYLSTDAHGIPTLNLLASPNDTNSDAFDMFDANGFIQLGIIGVHGGSTTYYVQNSSPYQEAFYDQYDGRFNGFSVTGQLVDVQAVPEPASMALIGLGLIGVGAMRRRKQ